MLPAQEISPLEQMVIAMMTNFNYKLVEQSTNFNNKFDEKSLNL